MIVIPEIPPARGGELTASASLLPRYEDVAQDGRVVLTALMPGLGAAIWRDLTKTRAYADFVASGIIPILRRVIIVGEPGPFSVNVPMDCEGTLRLAREANGERILLNMWLTVRAPHASTFAPNPPLDAPREIAGRVFAEHVFTRPFGAANERKVTRLEVAGYPEIPEDLHAIESAEALTAGVVLTPAREVAFGMMHTDSNQHVNSLVYPRMFEETLASMHPQHLMRSLDIRWRKPFFHGERATIAVAVSELGERLEARGTFTPFGESRPSAALLVELAR